MLYNNSVFCNILSGKVTILMNLTNLMINWLAFQLFWNTVSLKEKFVEIYYKVFFITFHCSPIFQTWFCSQDRHTHKQRHTNSGSSAFPVIIHRGAPELQKYSTLAPRKLLLNEIIKSLNIKILQLNLIWLKHVGLSGQRSAFAFIYWPNSFSNFSSICKTAIKPPETTTCFKKVYFA